MFVNQIADILFGTSMTEIINFWICKLTYIH